MAKCVLLVLCLVLAVLNARPEDKYTTKYDNVDITQILESDRLFGNYANCLLDRGTCGPDANELKKVISDALQTECEKCSEIQKVKAKEIIGFILNKKPEVWLQLEEKYDPTGKFRTKYESELAAAEEKNEESEHK